MKTRHQTPNFSRAELSTWKVRRLNQWRTAIWIWNGSAVLSARFSREFRLWNFENLWKPLELWKPLKTWKFDTWNSDFWRYMKTCFARVRSRVDAIDGIIYLPTLTHYAWVSRLSGSKIVISRIQTNFSWLTENSVSLRKNRLNKNAIVFWSSSSCPNIFGTLIKLIAGPVLKSSKSLYTFGYLRKSSGNLRKSLETISDLWNSTEIFGNLWKPLVNLRKFTYCEDEKSHAFYGKKVGRYSIITYFTSSFGFQSFLQAALVQTELSSAN